MKKIISLVLLVAAFITLAACSQFPEVAASTIAIDVNPSIVLELDEEDKVINVVMNNEDAVIIVGDMDLIGVDYNVAVNALLGSMVANGYINELANSVLLSIQSNDDVHKNELIDELSQAITDVLTGNSIEGSVITQELNFEDDAEELAEQLGISEAKAELILDIIEVDPRVTPEELAQLSINDLNLYLESKDYDLDDVDTTGGASVLGLITAEEAYQFALTELGLDGTSVVEFKVELEQEDGIMVYEVEIDTETEEYEVLIDAKEGTVFVENEDDEDDEDDEDQFPAEAMTEEMVLAAISTVLEIDMSLATELEVEREMDNNVAYYEIEFELSGVEYEIEVDAVTGTIFTISMEDIEYDDDDEYEDDDEFEDEDEFEDDDEDETEEEEESEEESTELEENETDSN